MSSLKLAHCAVFAAVLGEEPVVFCNPVGYVLYVSSRWECCLLISPGTWFVFSCCCSHVSLVEFTLLYVFNSLNMKSFCCHCVPLTVNIQVLIASAAKCRI